MEDKILTIPAVALRGMTILPGMVAHFDISRDKSLRAVEEAMKGDQKLFIVTQKDTAFCRNLRRTKRYRERRSSGRRSV